MFKRILNCRFHSSLIADHVFKKEPLTELGKIIKSSIKASGPISMAQYMQLCLTHPTAGYYMHRDVFGSKGDFTTSPEISQVFGELIAIWFLNELQSQQKTNIRIVELGPGRGTLMADILRTIKQFPEIYPFIKNVDMIDASPFLKEKQKETLKEFADEIDLKWHDRLIDVPNNTFTFYVAHEFLDALPVYQFKKMKEGWREIMVDQDNSSDTALNFRPALSRESTKALLLFEVQEHLKARDIDTIAQISPEGWDITCEIARRIKENNGIALIADYGTENISTDRFRGIKDHKWISPFSLPGKVDLSSDVEFSSIKLASEKSGVSFHGPVTQRDFLNSMGIGQRLMTLLKSAKDAKERKDLVSSFERLVQPEQMGTAYQFCTITKENITPYAFSKEAIGKTS